MAIPNIQRKCCSTCKQSKPAWDFYNNRYQPDGLSLQCRECVKRCTSGDIAAERRAALVASNKSARWRAVLGYEGLYSVSDRGDVRREKRGHGTWRGKAMRTGQASRRYAMASLTKNGKTRCFLVHRLVALAFIGPRPEGAHINHKDGDKRNNRLENLEYVTPKENGAHASRMGLYLTGENHPYRRRPETALRGERNGSATVNELQVRVIRRLANAMTRRDTAALFGVSYTVVTNIQTGKTWKHI